MHDNRLIVVMLATNAAVLIYALTLGGWWRGHTSGLRNVSSIAQSNLVLAVLLRQNWAINLVGWLAARPSTRWPLQLR